MSGSLGRRQFLAVASGSGIASIAGCSASGDSGGWDARRSGEVAHNEVNTRRDQEGLEALSWDTELYEIAKNYADRMAEEDFYGHEDPDGDDFEDRYNDAGYQCEVPTGGRSYLTGGENILQTHWLETVETEDGDVFISTPSELGEEAVDMWWNSQGHQDNILRDWKNEAIAFARSSDGKVYGVQNFC